MKERQEKRGRRIAWPELKECVGLETQPARKGNPFPEESVNSLEVFL